MTPDGVPESAGRPVTESWWGAPRSWIMRHRAVCVLVLVGALVLTAGTVVVLKVMSRTTRFSGVDTGTVTVTVPGVLSAAAVTELPAADPADLPFGMTALADPVHIQASTFSGDATLTIDYDPARIPAGADPASQLSMMLWLPEDGSWLPVGGTVDADAHTVTVSTDHFSTWVLAITDPAELAASEALSEHLRTSAGGRLGALITGNLDALSCRPEHLLLPARVNDPLALSAPLCEELQDDGSYRLQYVNTSGLPRVFRLPGGYSETGLQLFDTDELLGSVLAGYGEDAAVVGNGNSLDITFPGSAVDTGTTITGEVDWNVYLIGMERVLLGLALGAKDGGPLADALDRAMTSADMLDCLAGPAAHAATATSAGDLADAIADAFTDCRSAAGTVMGAAMAALGKESLWGKAKNVLRGRVASILALPELLEVARDEISGIGMLPAVLGGTDSAVRIQPARLMDLADAQALPRAEPGETGTCRPLAGGAPLPPGAPVGKTCVEAVTADLDGNGSADQLVTWTALDAGGNPTERGVVAFLDDGTFHTVEEPIASWTASAATIRVNQLHPADVLSLGADPRQQVLVSISAGANTVWHTVLALGADRRLHAITSADDGNTVALVPVGGGAGYSSRLGCVSSANARLVAVTSTRTVLDTHAQPSGALWTIGYAQLDDTSLRSVGRRAGLVDDVDTIRDDPQAGTDCRLATAAPAEIGPVGPAATTPDGAVRAVVQAAADNAPTAAASSLAGVSADANWRGGAGRDVWSVLTSFVTASPTAWVGVTSTCTPVDGGSMPEQTCTVQPAGGTTLTFLVQQIDTDRWTVGGAVPEQTPTPTPTPTSTTPSPTPTPSQAVSLTAFRTPTGNISCGAHSGTVFCFATQRDFTAPACSIGQPGFTIALDASGPARVSGCANDVSILLGSQASTVEYGTSVDLGPATCAVSEQGVRCSNGSNNGFTLNRSAHTEF